MSDTTANDTIAPADRVTATTYARSTEWGEIAGALALAQNAFEPLGKDRTVTVKMKAGGSYGYDYATLAGGLALVREHLNANGIALLQPFKVDATKVTVTTLLVHKSGQWISCDVEMGYAAGDGERMNRSQAIGSATTYARRYGLMAMTGVSAGEDDDDAGSSGGSDEKTTTHAARPLPPATVDETHDIPETVLSTRHIPPSTAGGKDWWHVQGSQREYVTDSKAIYDELKKAEAVKTHVIITFETKPGRREGSISRVIKTAVPVAAPTTEKK